MVFHYFSGFVFHVVVMLRCVVHHRFGRLPMVSISSVLYSVMAVGSCWLSSLPLLLVARFLMGTMHPTSLQTGYILGTCKFVLPTLYSEHTTSRVLVASYHYSHLWLCSSTFCYNSKVRSYSASF